MPTYLCYSATGTLTVDHKTALAGLITTAHSEATGAPTSFCQVMFLDLPPDGAHFIGGQPADKGTVFVYGNIRDGRPAQMKGRLMVALRDLVIDVTGVPEALVWVYLTELVPQQMIEFGQVLPEHGAEQAWMNTRPAELRERLLAYETASSDASGA